MESGKTESIKMKMPQILTFTIYLSLHLCRHLVLLLPVYLLIVSHFPREVQSWSTSKCQVFTPKSWLKSGQKLIATSKFKSQESPSVSIYVYKPLMILSCQVCESYRTPVQVMWIELAPPAVSDCPVLQGVQSQWLHAVCQYRRPTPALIKNFPGSNQQ